MIGSIVKGVIGIFSKDLFNYLDKRQDIELEKYKENSDVLTEAMRADVELAKVRQLQAINDNSNWMTRWIRPSFALPPIVYYAAIVLDSVWFHTNSVREVPTDVNTVFGVIVGFYFGGRVVEKIANKYLSTKK